MMTPWDFWMRSWESGIASTRAGVQFAELMQASGTVIASRTASMAEAARDPLNGDYRELSRMVPEKVAAFGSAARVSIADLNAIGAEASANWQQLAGIAMRGRAPNVTELAAMGERTFRIAERAIGAGAAAMKPVHTAATGNARRLRK